MDLMITFKDYSGFLFNLSNATFILLFYRSLLHDLITIILRNTRKLYFTTTFNIFYFRMLSLISRSYSFYRSKYRYTLPIYFIWYKGLTYSKYSNLNTEYKDAAGLN
jgi:hypothetical protein